MLKLGQKVKDRISGFSGVLSARSEFLNGCVRLQLTPDRLHEGKLIEAEWFDETQVDVLEDTPAPEPKTRPGGPRPEARRAMDPR